MPNQYSNAPGLRQKEIVLKFVRDNPDCTTQEIRDGTKVGDLARIGGLLNKLYNDGLVNWTKIRYARSLKWFATEAAIELEEDDAPSRTVVRQWWSGECQRDPLVAALFGPAPAQV